jgi:GDP-4-dehydro-6-deoxy-D-mannose reductase
LGFVAPDFAKQIAEAEAGLKEPIIHTGSLEPQRDFSDVRDVVRGYHAALTEGEPGEVYNLGSEQARSISELLDSLLSMASVSIKFEQDPARLRPADVPVMVSDCSRLRARTGWQTTIPFEKSLQDVLDYWRKRVVENGE